MYTAAGKMQQLTQTKAGGSSAQKADASFLVPCVSVSVSVSVCVCVCVCVWWCVCVSVCVVCV